MGVEELYKHAVELLGLGYADYDDFLVDLAHKTLLDETPACHKEKREEIVLATGFLKAALAYHRHLSAHSLQPHQEVYMAIGRWLSEHRHHGGAALVPQTKSVWSPIPDSFVLWAENDALTKAMANACYPPMMPLHVLEGAWSILKDEGCGLVFLSVFETEDAQLVEVVGASIQAFKTDRLLHQSSCRQRWPVSSSDLCFVADSKLATPSLSTDPSTDPFTDPWSVFFDKLLPPPAHKALMAWFAAACHCPSKRPLHFHDSLLFVLVVDDGCAPLVDAWKRLLATIANDRVMLEDAQIHLSTSAPRGRRMHWCFTSDIPRGALTWETRTHLLLSPAPAQGGGLDVPPVKHIGPWIRRAVQSLSAWRGHPFADRASVPLRHPGLLPPPSTGKVTYWSAWEDIVLASYKWYPVIGIPPSLDAHTMSALRKTLASCLTARDIHNLIEDWANTMDVAIDRRSQKVNPKFALSTFEKYFGKASGLSLLPSTFDGQWAITGAASSL